MRDCCGRVRLAMICWAVSNVARLTSGSWAGRSDQTHASGWFTVEIAGQAGVVGDRAQGARPAAGPWA